MKVAASQKIPFFNYSKLFLTQEKEYLRIISDVCRRGAYILQKDLEDFEKNLASYLKVKHAIGVANGTDALIIALKAAGIKPGQEVIVPSHTYIASAASIYLCGAKPVLADCGKDHMMDLDSVRKLITKKTAAVMPVHINGRTCQMDELLKLCRKHELKLVEDAAQALGSKFGGRFAGTFGLAGTFSFYPAKLLGCFGDGGAVVTNDDQIARNIRLLRDHGRNEDGRVVAWGYNSRLDNLQAAILNFKMKSFDQEITIRRKLAAIYNQELSSLPGLTLPPAPNQKGPNFDVYQNYEIEADKRDDLREFLAAEGIRTIIQWAGTPVHEFKELGFKSRLPMTDKIFKKCLLLPMNTSLSEKDVHSICRAIKKFYSGKGSKL